MIPNFIPERHNEHRYGPPVLLNFHAASNGLGLSTTDFKHIAKDLPHFLLASIRLYDGRVIAALTKYWLNWPPGSNEAYIEAISSIQHFPPSSPPQHRQRN